MSIAETVHNEIEQSKNMHGESWRGVYFNNFYLRFTKTERDFLKKSLSNVWNISRREWLNDNPQNESELYVNQSLQQYYETVDCVVEEAGISSDELQKLIQEIVKSPSDFTQFSRIYKQFCDLILPVYVRLRELGYSQQDLTG